MIHLNLTPVKAFIATFITIVLILLAIAALKPSAKHDYAINVDESNGVKIVSVYDGDRFVGAARIDDLAELIEQDNQ